jgi:glycosyltransferase involved in cell wall biosynthesis
MAGETVGIRPDLERAIAALRDGGNVQVVHRDGFVTDDEMHALFGCASLVLMPYQRHVGSSGVLVRAAAAGVPVLCQRYGMLGQLVEDRRLGLTVDTGSPEAIAAGLALFLDPAGAYPFDEHGARSFATLNTEDVMATTVFRGALGTAPVEPVVG